jgi:hypothetical protein
VILLTSDLDWAPAWMTQALAAAIEAAGFRATFFTTHACASLPHLRAAGHEVGIHPNHLPGSSHGADPASVLDHLAGFASDARGVRAHALVRSTPLLLLYGQRGFVYEGSDLMDDQPGLRPHVHWNGVVRLPVFFEDDVHAMHGRSFRLADLAMAGDGLRVFSVHPVHFVLNTRDLGEYQALKSRLAGAGRGMGDADPDDVAAVRNRSGRGTADLLDELLTALAAAPHRFGGRMIDVALQTRSARA